MAQFDPAYTATNKLEQLVLSNVATDRGGETYGGIARAIEPGKSWEGWQVIDRIVARGGFNPSVGETGLLVGLHATFFRQQFWAPLCCDAIPDQALASKVYDAAVNCGGGNAARWLQIALNLANRRGKLWPDIKVDGAIGAGTCAVIGRAAADPARAWLVLQLFETQQEQHYFQIAISDQSQEENLLGWYAKRITHVAPPVR